jgi:hypothetical protein
MIGIPHHEAHEEHEVRNRCFVNFFFTFVLFVPFVVKSDSPS